MIVVLEKYYQAKGGVVAAIRNIEWGFREQKTDLANDRINRQASKCLIELKKLQELTDKRILALRKIVDDENMAFWDTINL